MDFICIQFLFLLKGYLFLMQQCAPHCGAVKGLVCGDKVLLRYLNNSKERAVKYYSVLTLILYFFSFVVPLNAATALGEKEILKYGNSCRTATSLPSFGGSYSHEEIDGHIDFSGDYDYFSFQVNTRGNLYIYTYSNSVDTYGYLFDSNCQEISRDDDSGYRLNFSIFENVAPGVYYTAVRQYCTGCSPPSNSAYNLNVDFAPTGQDSALRAVNQLLLNPRSLPPFLGAGPSANGGIIQSNATANTEYLTTDSNGVSVITNDELNSAVKIAVQDVNGNKINGLKIQSRSLDGNLSFLVTDPLGRYAPVVYRGNPVLDAYDGSNPNITIEEDRFLLTVALLVTVAAIAYAEVNYILDVYEMGSFHISNIAGTIDDAGIFRSTVNELVNYMKANYSGKMATLNMITGVVTGGLPVPPVFSLGLTITNELEFRVLEQGFNSVAENQYNSSLSEMYGSFNGDTPIWVRIKNWESVGRDFFYNVDVDIMPIDYDDEFEQNDTLSSPVSLQSVSNNGLVVYEDDPDYYQFYLNQGDAWSAEANFMNRKGDINLYLFSPSGQLVASSQGTANLEQIALASADDYGNYVLKVANDGGEWDANMYNLSLSDLGGEISGSGLGSEHFRIVLTWGSSPRDLDSHLWTPSINGSAAHVYYSNKMNPDTHPYVGLDVDDISSYGPETITINRLYPGTYTYSVYNYSGGDIAGSGATVRIYNANGLIKQLTVPSSGSGEWWDIFEINGSTGALTVKNQVRSTSPRYVLKMPPK